MKLPIPRCEILSAGPHSLAVLIQMDFRLIGGHFNCVVNHRQKKPCLYSGLLISQEFMSP